MSQRESRISAAALRREFDARFAEAPRTEVIELEDVLAVRVGGDPYAIRISEIAGLHADRKIVPIPSPVPELLGLASFRGLTAPVYDLGRLLGYEGDSARRWLVLARAQATVGLAFDLFEAHLRVGLDLVAPGGASQGPRPHVRGAVRTADVVRPILHVASVLDAIKARVGPNGPPKER